MIYPKLSDGTIDWCEMCKHRGSDIFDLCCMCNYIKDDDPPSRYEPIVKPMTKGDRIGRMTDEDLAEWLWFKTGQCPPFDSCPQPDRETPCVMKDCWLDWLKEADDGTGKK